MKVTIKLFGVLRIDQFKEEAREYLPGTIVQEVLVDLNIPLNLLGTILINGVHAGDKEKLHDGDNLWLLPILCGG